jgi:hypothetical protein
LEQGRVVEPLEEVRRERAGADRIPRRLEHQYVREVRRRLPRQTNARGEREHGPIFADHEEIQVIHPPGADAVQVSQREGIGVDDDGAVSSGTHQRSVRVEVFPDPEADLQESCHAVRNEESEIESFEGWGVLGAGVDEKRLVPCIHAPLREQRDEFSQRVPPLLAGGDR